MRDSAWRAEPICVTYISCVSAQSRLNCMLPSQHSQVYRIHELIESCNIQFTRLKETLCLDFPFLPFLAASFLKRASTPGGRACFIGSLVFTVLHSTATSFLGGLANQQVGSQIPSIDRTN